MATSVEDKRTGLANPMGTAVLVRPNIPARPRCCATCSPKWAFRGREHKRKTSRCIPGRHHFIINASPTASPRTSRPSWPAPAMAFRVKDSKAAHDRASPLGRCFHNDVPRRLYIPLSRARERPLACRRYAGAAGSWGTSTSDFEFFADAAEREASHARTHYLDHLTHNVNAGDDPLAEFYENSSTSGRFVISRRGQAHRLFPGHDLAAAKSSSIEREQTTRSPIEEFLRAYKGEGIHHIGLHQRYISASTGAARDRPGPRRPIRSARRARERPGKPTAELKRARSCSRAPTGRACCSDFQRT